MVNKANVLFDDAAKMLNEANLELFRPEEDVVSFLVCKNAQTAIENYLKAFLYKNGQDAEKYKSIKELYAACKTINPKFEEVDLGDINCKAEKHEAKACSDIEKVSRCYNAADNLDSFLRREKIIT